MRAPSFGPPVQARLSFGLMTTKLRHALALTVLLPLGCHKNEAPAPAGSAAALAGSAAPGAAAGASLAMLDGFEGNVTLAAKGKLGAKGAAGAPVDFTLQVKDGKIRVDVPEGVGDMKDVGKVYLIVSPVEKKAFAVIDAKKQTVVIDFDKLAAQGKAMSAAHPSGHAVPDMKKTGKTDTVAGYSCEIWHLTQANQTTDLCIAQQSTPWFRVPLEGVPAEYAWASELADGKHFPLRMVMSEGGAEQGRLEVVSIEKKPLAASLFVVPADYPVLDLQQMLAGLMGGMAGMAPGMPGVPGMVPGMPPGGLPKGLPPEVEAKIRAAQAAHKKH